MRGLTLLLMCMMLALIGPATASADKSDTGGATAQATPTPAPTPPPPPPATGGSEFGVDPDAPPRTFVAGTKAKRLPSGFAAAPYGAPKEVQEAVFAANEIVGKPYVYGGGHTSTFEASGYDCSGTVSYALHGAGLLDSPLDSGSFMSWEERGKGSWITVFANGGHAYMVVAGLRLDTSSAGEAVSSGSGPRWRSGPRKMRGFKRRHPDGF
jgi:hypothetical protein